MTMRTFALQQYRNIAVYFAFTSVNLPISRIAILKLPCLLSLVCWKVNGKRYCLEQTRTRRFKSILCFHDVSDVRIFHQTLIRRIAVKSLINVIKDNKTKRVLTPDVYFERC